MTEKIKLACIKYNDKLYTGFNHGECFNKMKEDGLEGYGNEGQGFITDTGRFVDRKEAYFIAKEAGQIAYGLGQKHLISEDVHLSWLNEQAEQIRSLEEQLKNAIVPKFKIWQEVYYYHIARNKTYSGVIEDIQWFATRNGIYYRIPQLQRDYFWIREDELFVTQEEAEKRLAELEGK